MTPTLLPRWGSLFSAMTHFYLVFYPGARQAILKSIGLARRSLVFYQQEGESTEEFKKRAILEFNAKIEEWAQVPDAYKEPELLSTKTIY